MKKTPWQKFCADPQTWAAVDAFLEREMCEESVLPFLHHVMALPKLWEDTSNETAAQYRARHSKAADKLRNMAAEIGVDDILKDYRVIDAENVGYGPWVPYPTVGEYLRMIAGMIAAKDDSYADFRERKRSTRNELHQYVTRKVCEAVAELIPKSSTRPNAPTAKVINAVLRTANVRAVVNVGTVAKTLASI